MGLSKSKDDLLKSLPEYIKTEILNTITSISVCTKSKPFYGLLMFMLNICHTIGKSCTIDYNYTWYQLFFISIF